MLPPTWPHKEPMGKKTKGKSQRNKTREKKSIVAANGIVVSFSLSILSFVLLLLLKKK
jgi:hypothetical protein